MRTAQAVTRRALDPVVLAAVILAASGAGWSHDPAQNLPVVVTARGQCATGIVPDMRGGAIVTWFDPCSVYTSIPTGFPAVTVHALHLLERGDVDPSWPTSAPPLGLNGRGGGLVAPDSLGGAYFVWPDDRNLATSALDVYAQHLRADGTVDPAWPAGALPICTAPGSQGPNALVSDGRRGLIVIWTDRRDSATTGTDLYAAHLLANGTLDPAWPAGGRAIVTAPGSQVAAQGIDDGAGGAIVTFVSGGTSRLAQHLRANGTLDPAWPAGGTIVTTSALGNGVNVPPVSDGAGGAYLAWDKSGAGGVQLTHVLATGLLDPAWPAGGVSPDPDPAIDSGPALVADGHGGVFVVFQDLDIALWPTNEMVVRHYLATGVRDPGWPVAPVRLSDSPGNKGSITPVASAVADGKDGLIVAFWDDVDGGGITQAFVAQRLRGSGQLDDSWGPRGRAFTVLPAVPLDLYWLAHGDGTSTVAWSDQRDSAATYLDVFAQRLTEDGHLGLAVPAIHAVKDRPGDQGGFVTLTWYASAYDTLPADPVSEYDVWRRLFAAPAAGARRARDAGSREVPRPGDVRVTRAGARDVFWEFVGAAPSRGIINYALTVPTRADSTAGGIPREVYEVDVHGTALNFIASSDPDSGYSVDNLAPPAPTGFGGAWSAGSTQVFWDPSTAPDLAGYRLYRGSSPAFVPGPGSRVASPVTTHYTDTPAPPAWYKLTAVDVHDNEGPAAALLPAGVLAVGDDVPATLALTPLGARPAGREARLRYALPAAAMLRIDVFDAAGRRVRTLFEGARPAGVHDVTWDLRDAAGRPASNGLYFARLRAGRDTRVARLLIAR